MAKIRKAEQPQVKPMVIPKFNQLVFTNYKPLPRFRSGCLNCN